MQNIQDKACAKHLNMEAFKIATKNATQRGLIILQSVEGPYVFNPSAGIVVGRKGSAEYAQATSLQDTESPNESPSLSSTHAERIDSPAKPQ